MAQYTNFKTTPIKEIIFTISYLEEINIDSLKKFCESKNVSDKFNQISSSFTANLKGTGTANPPEASIINDGYVLKYQSENKSIQAKKGSFAFHKLNEYEHFDVLLQESLSYWKLFLEYADAELTISNISLRYLNFIDFHDGDSTAKLVNVKPENPFLEELKTYIVQLNFANEIYPDVNINLVSTKTVNKEDKTGIILDIILSKKTPGIQSFETLENEFSIMRKIKNDVFFKSITTYTANRYSHD